jgi:S1-C subfamily serine protease
MFSDANQGDYTISVSSLAHEIGFKNIATENIGVISPNLRAKALKVTIPRLQLPDVSTENKNLETEWLDAILRNVNGLGDRSAYGLASESGVVVVAVKESALIKSGLLAKDVIIGSNETPINDIFGLMSFYQGKSWTGKLSLNIMRDQQLKKIVIQLK